MNIASESQGDCLESGDLRYFLMKEQFPRDDFSGVFQKLGNAFKKGKGNYHPLLRKQFFNHARELVNYIANFDAAKEKRYREPTKFWVESTKKKDKGERVGYNAPKKQKLRKFDNIWIKIAENWSKEVLNYFGLKDLFRGYSEIELSESCKGQLEEFNLFCNSLRHKYFNRVFIKFERKPQKKEHTISKKDWRKKPYKDKQSLSKPVLNFSLSCVSGNGHSDLEDMILREEIIKQTRKFKKLQHKEKLREKNKTIR